MRKVNWPVLGYWLVMLGASGYVGYWVVMALANLIHAVKMRFGG